ncbi:hypothetical protein GGG16DRAFT_119298 [Schizophyllum commune]
MLYREDGSFLGAKSVTPILSQLKRAIRLTALLRYDARQKKHEAAQAPHLGLSARISAFLTPLLPFVQESNTSPFALLQSLQYFCSSEVFRTGGLPHCTWLSESDRVFSYKGTVISEAHLRAMVARTQVNMLKSFNDLRLGVDLRFDEKNLQDNLRDASVGYSVFSHRHHPYVQGLYSAFLASYLPRSRIVDTRSVNVELARKFLVGLAELEKNVLVMVQLASGGPARSTELLSLTCVNTKGKQRGVCHMQGVLAIVRSYSKTSHNQGHDKIIPNALDAVTQFILACILLYFRPLASEVSRECLPSRPDASSDYRTYLFMDHGIPFTEHAFREAIVDSAANICDGRITPSVIRHAFCGFNGLLRGKPSGLAPEDNPIAPTIMGMDASDPAARQAGHTAVTERMHYAVSTQALAGLTYGLMQTFLDVSHQWATYLHLTPGYVTGLPLEELTTAHFKGLLNSGVIHPALGVKPDEGFGVPTPLELLRSMSDEIKALRKDVRELKGGCQCGKSSAAESSNAQALVEDDPMDNDDDVEMGGSEGEELGVKTEDDDMAEWSFIDAKEEDRDVVIPATVSEIESPRVADAPVFESYDDPELYAGTRGGTHNIGYKPVISKTAYASRLPLKLVQSMRLFGRDPGTLPTPYGPDDEIPKRDAVWRIRELLGRSDAGWSMDAQREGFEVLLRNDTDNILVLPTSAGKTLMCTLPSLYEHGLTVIIVPLNSLLAQWKLNLDSMGINYHFFRGPNDDLLCSSSSSGRKPSIVLISADRAVNGTWAEALQNLRSMGHFIQRIIIDEAHLAITQRHFRPVFEHLEVARFAKCPVSLVSASIPPAAESFLAERFCLQDPVIVRELSDRPEIKYEVGEPWKGAKTDLPRIHATVQEWEKTAVGDDKLLIFVPSLAEGQIIQEATGFPFFYTQDTEGQASRGLPTLSDEDLEKIWKSFCDGTGPRCLIATSALSAGNDCRSITLVLHVGPSTFLLDYYQEASRGGRDGRKCIARLWPFSSPRRPPASCTKDQMCLAGYKEYAAYIKDLPNLALENPSRCYRSAFIRALDGVNASCIQIKGAQLCGLCEEALKRGIDLAGRTAEPSVQYTLERNPPIRPMLVDVLRPAWRVIKNRLAAGFGDVYERTKHLRMERFQVFRNYINQMKMVFSLLGGVCGFCWVQTQQGIAAAANTMTHDWDACPYRQDARAKTSLDAKAIKKCAQYEPGTACYTCHFPSLGENRLHSTFTKSQELVPTIRNHPHCRLVIPMIIAIRADEQLYQEVLDDPDIGQTLSPLGHNWDSSESVALWLVYVYKGREGKVSNGLKVLEWAVRKWHS